MATHEDTQSTHPVPPAQACGDVDPLDETADSENAKVKEMFHGVIKKETIKIPLS
jgi:hypothetical protein